MLCSGGKSVSAWHDIPLWAEDGLLNFICEIPKESSAKMEVATVRVFASAAHTAFACNLHNTTKVSFACTIYEPLNCDDTCSL